MRNVTRVSVHSDELSTTRHCSQANECELRWKWRKCGDFGLYNSIVIQSQIGTLNKYKRPNSLDYRRLTLTENQRPIIQSLRSQNMGEMST